MTKQTVLTGVKEVATGMKAGRKWALHKYTDEDGAEYTSFKSNFPLNEPIEIEYTEEEKKGRDDRVFINKRLVDPGDSAVVEATPVEEVDQGKEIMKELKNLNTKVDSCLRGLALLVDKKSE